MQNWFSFFMPSEPSGTVCYGANTLKTQNSPAPTSVNLLERVKHFPFLKYRKSRNALHNLKKQEILFFKTLNSFSIAF